MLFETDFINNIKKPPVDSMPPFSHLVPLPCSPTPTPLPLTFPPRNRHKLFTLLSSPLSLLFRPLIINPWPINGRFPGRCSRAAGGPLVGGGRSGGPVCIDRPFPTPSLSRSFPPPTLLAVCQRAEFLGDEPSLYVYLPTIDQFAIITRTLAHGHG